MEKTFFLSLFLMGTCTVFAQNTLQEHQVAARDAYKARDFTKFYEQIKEAYQLHPYHQGILFQAGLAAALTDRPDEAINFLSKAIAINASYDLESDDLKSLRGRPDFEKLKSSQKELAQPIIHSDTAFIIHKRDMHIEPVATGEKPGVFYLGSIRKRKIVRRDEHGKIKDFTTSGQDGLSSVFGIKTDVKNHCLWACASPFPIMEGFDSTIRSGLFFYDLKTGKLLKKFLLDDDRDHAFGDLVLDNSGKPYISDAKTSTIFTVDSKSNTLVPYFTSDEFWSLQGITFNDDGSYLFIADYVKGIFRLSTQDKTLIQMLPDFTLPLKSIDGMTYYNGSLICIQNLVVPMRSTIYRLNTSQDSLTAYEIIDRGHPAFNEPTIGCVSNDEYYYVANSLWSGYTQDNQLKPESELQEVVILKYNLKKK